MHGPRNQPVALHLAQSLREHLLADAFHEFAQARKSQFSLFRQHLKKASPAILCKKCTFCGVCTAGLLAQGNPAMVVIPLWIFFISDLQTGVRATHHFT